MIISQVSHTLFQTGWLTGFSSRRPQLWDKLENLLKVFTRNSVRRN
jgi:hypothetical protein